MKSPLIPIITIILLSNCTHNPQPNHTRIIDNTDPFASALWNKNIKYVLEEAFEVCYDTTTLDSAGNIIRVEEPAQTKRWQYNADRFITRSFWRGHVSENYVISYQYKGKDSLLQIWSKLPHRKWDYKQADLDSAESYTITFRFNEERQIIEKIDTSINRTTKYLYKNDLLVREETLHEKRLVQTKAYEYTGTTISKISLYDRPFLWRTYHYTNGILTARGRHLPGFIPHYIRYKYVY